MLRGVSATLVPADSHKQPIPLFPPQIRRGQGKWWMASPRGCQGLSVLRWIIPQKPPSSSITPTPHLQCDMHSLVCYWLLLNTWISGVEMQHAATVYFKGLWSDAWCIKRAGSIISRRLSCLVKVTGCFTPVCMQTWSPVNCSHKIYHSQTVFTAKLQVLMVTTLKIKISFTAIF